MAVRTVCVLRSGGEYTAGHVRWLAGQVPGLVCLSDRTIDGVENIPLEHAWPGWWSKLELFRPDLEGDLLYIDLDTVVLDELGELEVGVTTMLSDFYRPKLPGSGLMYIAQADKAVVWQAWIRCPHVHIARCRTRERWGDQGFLRDVLPHRRWDEVLPGQVVSYKVHCRAGVPAGAKVVCFHGQPRPWHVKHDWIPELR